MSANFTDLRCKEVICLCDGRRLGYISDICVELPEGHIRAIIVPGRCRCFGLLGQKEDFVIPWHCIRRIGPDIVLVDAKPDECRVGRHKPKLLF